MSNQDSHSHCGTGGEQVTETHTNPVVIAGTVAGDHARGMEAGAFSHARTPAGAGSSPNSRRAVEPFVWTAERER